MNSYEMNKFEIFPWSVNFETGIKQIDEQHKKLVGIINLLAANLVNGSADIILNEIFNDLAKYADFHFKEEEKIWLKYFKDDSWHLEHDTTHTSFIEEVVTIKNNKDNKHLDDVIQEIISFLTHWLAYHILESDKRMSIAVHAIEEGSSIEEAKVKADNEMSSSVTLLINTILTMYENISMRTLDLMREQSLRIQAEEALSKSEERWKFILEGGANNVWDWDIKNNKIYQSEEGISLFEIVGKNIKHTQVNSTIHPEDVHRVESDFQDHIDGKTEFFINKHRVIRKDGTWSWVLSRGKVVSIDEDGKALRIIGTHSDITERELASLIYKNSSQAICVCDLNKNVVSINPSFEKITGYKEKNIIGKKPHFFLSEIHNEKFYAEMWETINSCGYWSGEIYSEKENDEIYLISMEISSVKDFNGKVDYYFALFNDITEAHEHRKEREQQKEYLLQQSRMVQMGEMISMIAHQWRQPISAVSMAVNGVKLRKETNTLDDEYLDKKLDNINNYIQHMSETIDDFRNFYKPNKQKEKVDLSEAMKASLNIINYGLVEDNIKVITTYEDIGLVESYKNELMQVFLNILKNSRDAISEREISEPKIIIEIKKSGNKGYDIFMSDNAGGIKETILDKIFDPYFSTKDEFNGTGLGLYMSKNIINEHCHGSITVKNTPDGTLFKIFIPR